MAAPDPAAMAAELTRQSAMLANYEQAMRDMDEKMRRLEERFHASPGVAMGGPHSHGPSIPTDGAAPNARLPPGVKPPLPGTFHGNKDSDEIKSWLFQVKDYFSLVNMTDDESKVRLAGTLLRGNAATWFRAVRGEDARPEDRITTWARFESELCANFMPLNSTKVARDKLAALTQTGAVRDYVREFRTIILDIPRMSEDEKLDRFTRGLKRYLRKEVEIREITSMEDAMRLVERLEAAGRRADWSYYPGPTPGDYSAPSGDPMGGGTPSTDSAASSSDSSTGPAPMDLNHIDNDKPASGGKPKYTKITPEERAYILSKGGCVYCRKLDHNVDDCPVLAKRHTSHK